MKIRKATQCGPRHSRHRGKNKHQLRPERPLPGARAKRSCTPSTPNFMRKSTSDFIIPLSFERTGERTTRENSEIKQMINEALDKSA